MDRQLVLLNNPSQMINKETINKLIVEINKLNINKTMKQILLIASLNLLSSVKTTKGLIYQLESFRNQGKIYPEKTRSKYHRGSPKRLASIDACKVNRLSAIIIMPIIIGKRFIIQL